MSTETKPGTPATDPFQKALVDHHNLVNKELWYPDVHFHFDDGKTVLMAHYYILKMRLPQLLEEGPAASGKKQKAKKAKTKEARIIIKINKAEMITARALERVLVYAYSGVIDERDYTPFKAIEVMRCCSLYNISRLMQMNEKYLQDNLTMKNIFSLLKAADDHNVQEAKDICINFALANGDFFTSANAEELGFKLYQEVTALLLKATQDKSAKEIIPREVTADDTIVKDFKNLLGSADSTGDVSFLIHGTEVKAHRPIVAYQSTDLANLLRDVLDDAKEGAKKHVVFDSKYERITPDAFGAMLRFFYYGDTNIDMIAATQLMTFAKDYKLNSLYAVLERVVSGQDVSIASVLSVLGVAYHPLMDENPTLQKNLKEAGLNFAVEHLTEIDFEPLIMLPSIIGVHILVAAQKKIGDQYASLNVSDKISLSDLRKGPGAGPATSGSSSNFPSTSGWQKTTPGTPSGATPSPRLQSTPSKRDAGKGKEKEAKDAPKEAKDSKEAKEDKKKDEKSPDSAASPRDGKLSKTKSKAAHKEEKEKKKEEKKEEKK